MNLNQLATIKESLYYYADIVSNDDNELEDILESLSTINYDILERIAKGNEFDDCCYFLLGDYEIKYYHVGGKLIMVNMESLASSLDIDPSTLIQFCFQSEQLDLLYFDNVYGTLLEVEQIDRNLPIIATHFRNGKDLIKLLDGKSLKSSIQGTLNVCR